MEYIEGDALDDLISRNDAAIQGVAAVPLFEKLGQAIAHAHEQQVVHRDIKPSNVIVEHEGAPRLVDFGLVAILNEPRITVGRPGTPIHLAPEYVDTGVPTPLIDIYAFGVTMCSRINNLNNYFAGLIV